MLFKSCKDQFGYLSATALSCPRWGLLQNVALVGEHRPNAGVWPGFRHFEGWVIIRTWFLKGLGCAEERGPFSRVFQVFGPNLGLNPGPLEALSEIPPNVAAFQMKSSGGSRNLLPLQVQEADCEQPSPSWACLWGRWHHIGCRGNAVWGVCWFQAQTEPTLCYPCLQNSSDLQSFQQYPGWISFWHRRFFWDCWGGKKRGKFGTMLFSIHFLVLLEMCSVDKRNAHGAVPRLHAIGWKSEGAGSAGSCLGSRRAETGIPTTTPSFLGLASLSVRVSRTNRVRRASTGLSPARFGGHKPAGRSCGKGVMLQLTWSQDQARGCGG